MFRLEVVALAAMSEVEYKFVEVELVAFKLVAKKLVEVAEVEVARIIVTLAMVEVLEFERMPPVRVERPLTSSVDKSDAPPATDIVPVAVKFPPIKASPPTVRSVPNVVVPIPSRLFAVSITRKPADPTVVAAV